ncbi:MAG: tripartite tricarboxylate transporter substrate binding protein [Treponema sp.]|nr:tripartite tricarboxylate transporter substrate binding protein [Treponema sp.]
MKRVCMAALAVLTALSVAGCKDKAKTAAAGGEWKPSGTVTMIVAYKAGSGTDNTARVLTSYAEKYIGQSVVIDNKEGGSGSIGWTALAKAKPDGLTLGFINLPTFCSNIIDHLGSYTVESIEPIANHVVETSVVLVSAKSPFNTLQELVDYAKANPGKLKASTNGNKASNHIGAQLLAHSAQFTYTAIPYGGTADQLLALRQGEVDFSVAKVADFASFASELKVLGTFDTKRIPEYPDTPTLGELGFYPDWYGSARCIVAPKGTPKEAIAFYADAFKKIMDDPEYKAAGEKAHMTTEFKDPEATGALINQQYDFCANTLAEIFK